MITIDSLTRKYGAFTAVDDVTFTAEPGRVTGFLGPNGAGKSTTMRVLVGLTEPTAGRATILGRMGRRNCLRRSATVYDRATTASCTPCRIPN